MRHLFLVALSISSLFMQGCARRISANSYHAGHVGEASETYKGVVVSKRVITVQESERMQDNTTGMVAGGVAGGLLGSMVGKGKGSLLGGIAGAGLGATGGAFLQDHLGTQDGIEYVIRLENGRMMTVVQGPDVAINIGQSVLIMVSHTGRSRVIPA
jgi:outer membrane lipoprotein SlyB